MTLRERVLADMSLGDSSDDEITVELQIVAGSIVAEQPSKFLNIPACCVYYDTEVISCDDV
jgi:hypothetical protein